MYDKITKEIQNVFSNNKQSTLSAVISRPAYADFIVYS